MTEKAEGTRAPQNDGYSLTSVGARERERGRLEERIVANNEIAAIKAEYEAQLEEVRSERKPMLDVARAEGAASACDTFKFEVVSVIARTNLPTAQRRMITELVNALPIPKPPDLLDKKESRIAALELEAKTLSQQLSTQVAFKQGALRDRAEALSKAATIQASALEDGRIAGLREAAEMIRGASIQKSAKGPTKTSRELADQIMGLAKP